MNQGTTFQIFFASSRFTFFLMWQTLKLFIPELRLGNMNLSFIWWLMNNWFVIMIWCWKLFQQNPVLLLQAQKWDAFSLICALFVAWGMWNSILECCLPFSFVVHMECCFGDREISAFKVQPFILSLLFFWLHEAYSWLFSFLVFFWKRCHLTSVCVPSTWKVVYNFFFSFFFFGLGKGPGAIPLLEKGILGCAVCWGI